MWRDDAYLLDMLLASRKIRKYTLSLSEQEFLDNEILRDAVMRQVQIVGEAASRISKETRDAHPEIPWQGIIGMRHRLVHDYFHIDSKRIWAIIQKEIPELISLLEPIVPPDESPGDISNDLNA